MADVALLASQAGEAPIGYQVPGAQEIILKSITASFDGTGASGDFLPVLQIVAPNGSVLASCPVSTQVAAGGSADVSWFPRGGVAASTGGSLDTTDGVVDVNPTSVLRIGANIVLTNPSPGVARIAVAAITPVVDQTERITFTATAVPYAGNTLLPFAHVSGAALLDYTTATTPKIKTTGLYALTLPLGWIASGGAPAFGTWAWNAILVDPSGAVGPFAAATGQIVQNDGAFVYDSSVTLTYVAHFAANAKIGVLVDHFWPGGPLTFGKASFCAFATVQRIA